MEDLQEAYKKHFRPAEYIRTYYGENELVETKLYASMLHEIFDSGVVKPGGTLLEIGSGPIVHSLTAPSRLINHITSSDFLEQNRTEVQKWKNAQEDAYDWSYVFKYHAELENVGDYHILESRVRNAIEEIVPCNVHLANPIAPICKTFDVVLTCFCLEVASTDDASYKSSLRNVASLMKSGGGIFVEIGSLGSTHYTMGGRKFPTMKHDQESIRSALHEAGLTPIKWKIVPKVCADKPTDLTAYYAVVATKK